jgi:glycosyltransferase involved in cell wall biosynthesis
MFSDPHITVIVLTKNCVQTIDACLSSIVKQAYPKFDVLILDDKSRDGTRDILYDFNNKYPFISVGESDNVTIGRGRQIAIEQAKGEYIAFVDSDVELPHKLWLNEMVIPLKDDKVAGSWTLGAFKSTYPSIAKYAILETDLFMGEIPEIVDKQAYRTIGLGHSVLKKSLVIEAGGFKDMIAGEDRDLTIKLVNMGYIFKFVNHRAFHLHATSYSSYMRKYERNLKAPAHSEGKAASVQKPDYKKFLINSVILPIPVSLQKFTITGERAWLWHPIISYSKCFIIVKNTIGL